MKLTVVFEDHLGNVVAKNEQGTLFVKGEVDEIGTLKFVPVDSYTLRRNNGDEVLESYEPLDTGDIFT